MKTIIMNSVIGLNEFTFFPHKCIHGGDKKWYQALAGVASQLKSPTFWYNVPCSTGWELLV